ncbi:MAG: signal peptidase I [Oscillospiraceae bacterium]|nr:signal peptidase I [Oscillospiraceae bacterium]
MTDRFNLNALFEEDSASGAPTESMADGFLSPDELFKAVRQEEIEEIPPPPQEEPPLYFGEFAIKNYAKTPLYFGEFSVQNTEQNPDGFLSPDDLFKVSISSIQPVQAPPEPEIKQQPEPEEPKEIKEPKEPNEIKDIPPWQREKEEYPLEPGYIEPSYLDPRYLDSEYNETPLYYDDEFDAPEPAAIIEPLRETENPKAKGGKTSLIFNSLFYLLCTAIVIGAALFAFSNDPGKSYFGYRLYTVKTPSMTPQPDGPAGGFYAGDMIFVKLVEPETLREGDIITFMPNKNNSESFLTHRIVGTADTLTDDPNEPPGLYFITRGDANNADDPPISADMVIGKKVGAVRRAGFVVEAIRGNLIPILLFVVIAFAFIFTLRSLLLQHKSKRQEDAADTR